ncbi:general alpha-glucoside permease [Trichoderma velutinum]
MDDLVKEKQDTVVQHAELDLALERCAQDGSITDPALVEAALEATADDHELGVWEALKTYPHAVGWALVAATCVIMEGYDTSLLNNFFAYPSFLIRYGKFVGVTPSTPAGYQLTAAWQAGLSQGTNCGSIIGCFISGWIVQRWGTRTAQLGSLISLSCFIFIVFFSPNLQTLVVGEILCGIPWGILSTTSPAYASEVLPNALRVYLTSYTNMCFIIGQLISAGVIKGLSTREDQWGYRLPFAMQWVWPIFLIPLSYMSPESPWHLVRKGKLKEAEASLDRLRSKKATHVSSRKKLAAIVYTNNLERSLSVGTSYWDCLKGTELRRTEIASMCFSGQTLSGIMFAYNSSYFFSQIGLGTSTTYSLNLGGTGLAFIGCLINWFVLMPRFGYRTIYTTGIGAMCVTLFIVGILSPWTDRFSVGMTQACLTLLWTFFFQLSAGQLGWALPAEMGSSRLRQKTICLARESSNLINIAFGILQQYFMNPQAWNLRGYTGFFWGGTCLGMFIWCYFRLPETKGRTFDEIDVLFAKKISARKFASTVVDSFNENDIANLAGQTLEKKVHGIAA